jgi:hypothetical protein
MSAELALYISGGFFSVILFYILGAGYGFVSSIISSDERG